MLTTSNDSLNYDNNIFPLVGDVLDFINQGTANLISVFNTSDGDQSLSSNISWEYENNFSVKSNIEFCLAFTSIILSNSVLDTESDEEYYNDIFLSQHLQHYSKIYELEKNKMEEAVSSYTTILMYALVKENDIDSIDIFIKNLDRTLLSRWSLIALLRTTCVYKHEIESWKDLFLYTRTYLNDNGHNAKRLLMGLDRGLGLVD